VNILIGIGCVLLVVVAVVVGIFGFIVWVLNGEGPVGE
jgi:hypothetical protein